MAAEAAGREETAATAIASTLKGAI